MLIPTTIIDNFFETPTLVRDLGLSLNFGKPSGGVCPGVRTPPLHSVNQEFHNFLANKISSVFFNSTRDRFMINMESYFQQSFEKYQEGWIHQDQEKWSIAGVIYLTPDPPTDSGTSLYNIINHNFDIDHSIKYKFYDDQNVDIEEMKKLREHNNSQFKKTLDVENVFNRALMFNAQNFHKENKFFGNNALDCRFTLLFFADLTLDGNTKAPLDRIKNINF